MPLKSIVSQTKLAAYIFIVAAFSFIPSVASADTGKDYIDALPLTVYETEGMNPQNMDYDRENKMFPAHQCWIKDKLVYYYKFRMYTPKTYPESIKMGQDNKVATMPIYIYTTTGDLSGIVEDQYPIYPFHTSDGEMYSDFVQVQLVKVSKDYVANSHKSEYDLHEVEGITPTQIYLNAPLVPNGSKLEAAGGGMAPIKPIQIWYKGQEAQAFYFETTDQAFADIFNPLTRVGNAAEKGSGYEITVSQFVEAEDEVSYAPIWHFNQYSFGVTEGVNNGGPSSKGQMNVVDTDRLDDDYSPLWQVLWATKVPEGYQASTASNADVITPENGFEIKETPMYVNCPNIGPHGGVKTDLPKAKSFGADYYSGEKAVLRGALIMEGGKDIMAYIGEEMIGETKTGMMGEYSFEVDSSAFESMAKVDIKDMEGKTLQTFQHMEQEEEGVREQEEAPTADKEVMDIEKILSDYGLYIALGVIALLIIVAIIRKRD